MNSTDMDNGLRSLHDAIPYMDIVVGCSFCPLIAREDKYICMNCKVSKYAQQLWTTCLISLILRSLRLWSNCATLRFSYENIIPSIAAPTSIRGHLHLGDATAPFHLSNPSHGHYGVELFRREFVARCGFVGLIERSFSPSHCTYAEF